MHRSRLTVFPALLGILLACSSDPDETATAILSFEASAAKVQAGELVTLSWTTSGATSFVLSKGDDSPLDVDPADWEEGSLAVTLDRSTTFVLAIAGKDSKEVTEAVSVEVGAPPADVLAASLTAQPDRISFGDTVTLTWTSQNATQVTLSDGEGIVPGSEGETSGVLQLEPGKTTIYTLAASAGEEEITRTATVVVEPTILEFEVVTEGGFNPGDIVEFRWKTGAGLEATLSTSEESLEIATDDVAEGGASIQIGSNGRVTLEVRDGDLVTSKSLNLPLLSFHHFQMSLPKAVLASLR